MKTASQPQGLPPLHSHRCCSTTHLWIKREFCRTLCNPSIYYSRTNQFIIEIPCDELSGIDTSLRFF
ncbi:MAG: hypothetical protein LBE04_02975, partial [Prevotellaceae bacterium]|nr:hypothetical protein [Prevotellaceae bacterium]